KPIKFSGTGEKMENLEPFHPDRMASRILGMGDVLTLIEKAEGAFSQEQALNLQKKLKEKSFTLEDYLEQMDSMKKMGNINDMVGMIPGLAGKLKGNEAELDEAKLVGAKAIILSMTPKERKNPELIKSSQKKRIAKGSGRGVQEVNQLLKQFELTKDLMSRMSKGGMKGLKGMKGLPF
ncbi:MAG: signal recognition particle protein, partial [Clostridia bacterium]